MRRFYISIGMMVIIIAAGISCLIYVHIVYKESSQMLQEIYQSTISDDFETAYEKSARFSSYWEKHERTIILFVRHYHIDEISSYSVKLTEYLSYQDGADSAATIKTLLMIIETIWQEEQPTLHSIF